MKVERKENVGAGPERPTTGGQASGESGWRGMLGFAGALGTVAICTVIGEAFHGERDPLLVFTVFLVGGVLVALRWGRGPSALAWILSLLSFDYFFEVPRFRLAISNWPNLAAFAFMLFVVQVVAVLVHRLRRQLEEIRFRESQTASLLRFNQSLSEAEEAAEVLGALERHASEAGDGPLQVSFESPDLPHPSSQPDGSAWTCRLPGMSGRPGLRFQAAATPRGPALGMILSMGHQAILSLERLKLRADSERAHLEREAEQTRNTLLAAISHDLRTPLSAIHGAASTLLLGPGSFTEGTRDDLLAMIQEESSRLEHLLENLLQLTRLQGGLQARREWVPAEELVGAALLRMRKDAPQLRIRTHLKDAERMVNVDSSLIQHLMVNLLGNVERHAPGSVAELSLEVGDEAWTLEVADQGPGVPEPFRDRVFEKFARGPWARGDGGSGLGLAICRSVVQLHGGGIAVVQGEGGGACFRCDFPVRMPGDPPAPAGGPVETGGEEP